MDLLPDLVGLNRSPLDAAWREWLAGDLVAQPYAIAFSGGADSTALLVQAVGMARISAQSRPVVALHIHHGLQPAADDFVTHCESICVALDRQFPTRLHVEHITVALDKGDSIEAKAREARYAALAAVALARGIHTVLLAQHADDQVETVLLALTRGAGLAGLSGMAPNFERDGVQFGRPMLDVAARDLRDWLNAARIPYLQDPSNDDQRFTRNRLRHSVVPGLQAAFPAYRTTFGRSAGLAFQAQQLLVEVAEQDLASIGSPALRRRPPAVASRPDPAR